MKTTCNIFPNIVKVSSPRDGRGDLVVFRIIHVDDTKYFTEFIKTKKVFLAVHWFQEKGIMNK